MKILYTDAHLHSLNPTNTLMSTLVAAAVDDICFYGPGFVSEAQLSQGLLRFIDQTGPYDALVLGPNVPLFSRSSEDTLAAAKYAKRFTALASSPNDLVKYFDDVLAAVPLTPIPLRFACLVTLDYYGCTGNHIERLEKFGLHVIAPDSTFATRLEQLPRWANQEAHFVRKKDRISNAWADFTTAHPDRIVTALHFIADSEFSFRGLSARTASVSIPGVEYVLRRQAVAALKEKGIRLSTKGIFNGFRLANRIGLPVFGRFVPLKLFNLFFFRDLIDTRFVYTARGAFGIPIRKFFEIPAAGAMMICSPPLGFSEIGFRDGEHYINADPANLPDILQMFGADIDRAQAIAAAGRKLVFEKHSLRARAEQLRACLEAIKQGAYESGSWKEGSFTVVSKKLKAS
ncbi:MAG: glycosyltransferase [Polaromonas sp.]|nr:glycosyltransferase [Polaromonas sp.]